MRTLVAAAPSAAPAADRRAIVRAMLERALDHTTRAETILAPLQHDDEDGARVPLARDVSAELRRINERIAQALATNP